MMGKHLCLILLFAISLFASHSSSLPLLSTNNRWIVDEFGERWKLHCINWSTHINSMVVEGIGNAPLSDIVAQIKELGFNCVRFTFATHMFTRYANRRVGESLDSLRLRGVRLGIRTYNPCMENVTLVEAFDVVVDELGKHELMVLADNHVSDPQWCCGENDGNGFFGDKHFNPEEWLQGLSIVANRVIGKRQVMGIGLRNELRGPRQNQNDWYKYMSQGATTVHKANPNVLVFVSGLNYDTDLSFLKTRPLTIDIGNKLVYEVHSYAWSGGSRDDWIKKPLNQQCARAMKGLSERAGFVMSGQKPAPLVMSEFGMDMTKMDESNLNTRFLSCMLAYLVGVDLDWALWTAQGGYYIKDQNRIVDETYGLWMYDFQSLRYPQLPQRFQLAQMKLQDPSNGFENNYVIYHPQSGQCVIINNTRREVELGDCKIQSRWVREGEKIKLFGKERCLNAIGDGISPRLSKNCRRKMSSWKTLSMSNLHLGTTGKHGHRLCLERESTNSTKIVTRRCICVDDDPTCLDNPQSQWFQLVTANIPF